MEMQMFNCNHKVKQIITKSYTVHVTFNCFFFFCGVFIPLFQRFQRNVDAFRTFQQMKRGFRTTQVARYDEQ